MLDFRRWPAIACSFIVILGTFTLTAAGSQPSPELASHITAIAELARPSAMVPIPAGAFPYGSKSVPTAPYGNWTPFDDTELPQHHVWLDAYEIDRDEISLGEYLVFLQQRNHHPSNELQKLLWHVITIHFISDETLTRWPALYVTWAEANALCAARDARLPTEAEWEKAARGSEGNLFPWGESSPNATLAMFGQHHVHEIPILASVDSLDQGRSPYGLHHMAGNVAEWVHDWFGPDYYAYMPERNPPGPARGRYKGVRGGSWKSARIMLRTATRGGASPNQRSATVGFRCARSLITNAP
ncbi:MAG: SUMF1/EgtB/PvdO family nonheme iron enzyme [Nitrospira sp.]|nr:SUMF1/EgtB/PvdO family nonheme iron enzyme [Nitrospira sp.]